MAHRLTNNSSDQDASSPLLDATEANTGERPNAISADNGFCSEANLQGLINRTVRDYVTAGRASTPDGGKKGAPLMQAMRTRLRQRGHQSRYRKRKYTVDPVFGHIKQARVSDNFSSAASTRFASSGRSSTSSTNSQNNHVRTCKACNQPQPLTINQMENSTETGSWKTFFYLTELTFSDIGVMQIADYCRRASIPSTVDRQLIIGINPGLPIKYPCT